MRLLEIIGVIVLFAYTECTGVGEFEADKPIVDEATLRTEGVVDVNSKVPAVGNSFYNGSVVVSVGGLTQGSPMNGRI